MSVETKNIETILLVDDFNLFLIGLKEILENRGFSVHLANNKDEAISILSNNVIDLMISDMNLGTGQDSGLKLSNIVRMNNKDLPILLMSMHDDPRLILTSLSIGIKGYLLKDNCDEDITNAIAYIEKGKGYLCKSVKKRLMEYSNHKGSKVTLSPELIREFEIDTVIA